MAYNWFNRVTTQAIRAIAKKENRFTRKLNTACKIYSYAYLGFSYDSSENGESDLVARIAHIMQDEKAVLFDVGCNVGDYLELFNDKFLQFEAHGFEIQEATFRNLNKRWSGMPNVKLNNVGLLNVEGMRPYRDYGENAGINSTIIEADFHHGRPFDISEAKFQTGDQYCSSADISHIDLLKIDVEGAEHLVLQGFSEMLENQKIRVIQFEYGYAHGDSHFLMKDFFRFFEEYGYVVAPVRKKGIIFNDFKYEYNDFMSGPNYVAISSHDAEMCDVLSGK